MTIVDSLRCLTAYPINSFVLQNALIEGGLEGQEEYTYTLSVGKSKGYKKAKAIVLRYLATAPNVSQGGVSYSFNAEDKAKFNRMADALLEEIGETEAGKEEYGYIGENF